jgi:hypothetical protein
MSCTKRILGRMEFFKQRRNEVFRAVVGGGLDPIECELESTNDGRSKLTHIPSGSYLTFTYFSGVYSGSGKIPDGPPVGFQGPDWSSVIQGVERWAARVVETIETPDLWAELRRGREILSGTGDVDLENTPFTSSEQGRIAEQLREIKEYLSQQGLLTAEQLSLVEARLDQAEEASRHLGRKDWVLLFGGVILSLIVADLLPPAVAEHILMAVLHSLEHLFSVKVTRAQIQPRPR